MQSRELVEGVMEDTYTVMVRNDLTGEMQAVSVVSVSPEDAQIEALVQLFKRLGWRKAVAFRARLEQATA